MNLADIHLWKFLVDNWVLILTGLGLGWYTSTVLIHAFNIFDGAERAYRRFRGTARPEIDPIRPARYEKW